MSCSAKLRLELSWQGRCQEVSCSPASRLTRFSTEVHKHTSTEVHMFESTQVGWQVWVLHSLLCVTPLQTVVPHQYIITIATRSNQSPYGGPLRCTWLKDPSMRGATHPTTRGATPTTKAATKISKELYGKILVIHCGAPRGGSWRPSWWGMTPFMVGMDTPHSGGRRLSWWEGDASCGGGWRPSWQGWTPLIVGGCASRGGG